MGILENEYKQGTNSIHYHYFSLDLLSYVVRSTRLRYCDLCSFLVEYALLPIEVPKAFYV